MPFYNDLRPQSDYEDRDFALVFPGMSDEETERTGELLLSLERKHSLIVIEQSGPPLFVHTNIIAACEY